MRLLNLLLDWYYGPNRSTVRIDDMGGDEILIVTSDAAYSFPNTPENRAIVDKLIGSGSVVEGEAGRGARRSASAERH